MDIGDSQQYTDQNLNHIKPNKEDYLSRVVNSLWFVQSVPGYFKVKLEANIRNTIKTNFNYRPAAEV